MRQKWKPGKKGVRPNFPVDPCIRFVYRIDSLTGRYLWSWRTESGAWVMISDRDTMSNYHLIQIKRTLERQNYKWSKWWYVVDAELTRRGVGITRRANVAA